MRKSLRDYSMNIEEEAYHAYPAWSYSMIADYAKNGFAAIATLHDKKEPTPSMEFGSLFDSLLTKGKATLDEYVVMDKDVPQAEKKCLAAIASECNIPNLMEVPRELIMKCAADSKYKADTNWGFEAKFKHLNEYEAYYRALVAGKKVVSKADWDDAVQMYHVFRKDDYLKRLFGTKNTDDIEYIYQAQFLIDHTVSSGEVVKIKIMPDLIVVNHKDKTIQPVDLKTSSVPAWQFKENFIKFRYDIQAQLYTYALQVICNNDEDYRSYTILPYLFTDISRSDKVPVTYTYNQFAEDQQDGFTYYVDGKTYMHKHWTVLLDNILEYEKTKAVVPFNIKLGEPNDLLEAINSHF